MHGGRCDTPFGAKRQDTNMRCTCIFKRTMGRQHKAELLMVTSRIHGSTTLVLDVHTFEIRSATAEHVCRPPNQHELLTTAIEALDLIPPCVGDLHLRVSCTCLYLANSNKPPRGGTQRRVSGWRCTICYCCGTAPCSTRWRHAMTCQGLATYFLLLLRYYPLLVNFPVAQR